MPVIALSGVRISWLMLARKALLATVAASASTLAETKPAFSILFYPVITAEKGKGHQGSFNALLGGSRNAESDTWYSLQNRVTAQTPPTLLLLSDDDKVVPPEHAYKFLSLLENSTGVILPHCGHWAMIEHPEKFAGIVETFFDGKL